MGGHHASFSLFPRSNGIYSFQIWNPGARRYEVARSTGTRNKAKAKSLANAHLEKKRQEALTPTDPIFASYLLETWDWDASSYVRSKLLRRPDGLTKAYVQTSLSFCRRYAKPFFKDRKLSAITSRELENFLLTLRDTTKLAPKSINAVYDAAAIPLREACRLGMIANDPTKAIRKLWVPHTEKGIPTINELHDLLGEVQGEGRLEAACLLAATCGLRLGEIRALRFEDIEAERLFVRHSYSVVDGLKKPKNGRQRVVPLPQFVHEKLMVLASKNPQGEQWLLWGKASGKPVSPGFLEDGFNEALARIGISDKARVERRLSFHSLRHFCNSMLRGTIPDEKLRLLTGHRSEAMTEHYDHVTDLDLAAMRVVQDSRIVAMLRNIA